MSIERPQAIINGEEFYFPHRNIVSADQFTRVELDGLFDVTQDEIRYPHLYRGSLDRDGSPVDAVVFFTEPSTRTYLSFMKSFNKLGADVVGIIGGEYSSISKGESIEDTMMTLKNLETNVVVFRHSDEGSAQIAAEASNIPFISAGDGPGEHPTQAILDTFTIKDRLGDIDGKTVTMLGDLKNGRTIHSLSRLLALYEDVTVNYVSPEELRMPNELMHELGKRGLRQFEYTSIEDVIEDTDVLNVVRTQRERFTKTDGNGSKILDDEEFQKFNGMYRITPEVLKQAKNDMILMHPFPRNEEISREVDKDPRIAYDRQIRNGLYTRTALLTLMLEQRIEPRRINTAQEYARVK